ncbi:ATP-binding protein [Amycolatopsis anabasis]|uniref:ATP-binding protein n=1 Tax=Amycolatopsis anabasis TaxID=1840409 RepID=UPI00131B75BC|nr:ATP-binding protein [Amycolatopsis anabasis]
MQAHTRLVALKDLDTQIVDIRVDLGAGTPELHIHGLSQQVSRETRDRVRAALRNAAQPWPERSVHVTCSTAHPQSDVDLAVAVAILLATGRVPARRLLATALIGELSLDGRVRPVRGVLPRAMAAAKFGCTHLVVPAANAAEASHAPGITIVPVAHLTEVITWLTGGKIPAAVPTAQVDEDAVDQLWAADTWARLDPGTVRAAALAAAGGHHTLFLARPGTGASLLPRLVTALMPDLTDAHAREVTALHSLAGAQLPASGLIMRPPRACPHHTTSMPALLGKGAPLRPGAVTLAHHGVLHLQDLPEFPGPAIEALRAVLDHREVALARAHRTVQLPAAVRAVFTARDCPGGCASAHDCTCTPFQRARYRRRIPLWLVARTDLFVQRLSSLEPGSPVPSFDAVRASVVQAQDRAAHRWDARKRHNGKITDAQVAVGVPSEVTDRLDDAVHRGGITTVTASRCLKLAWTMADLDQRARPALADVNEILDQRQHLGSLLFR